MFKRVFYIDAVYFVDIDFSTSEYLSKFEDIYLGIHEAYGYVANIKNGDILLDFIFSDKRIEENKGIIIPFDSIIDPLTNTYCNNLKNENLFNNLVKDYKYEIYWKDVVYKDDNDRIDSSKMFSVGEIIFQSVNFIFIKNPETIRIYPLPIKNHPKEPVSCYAIPKSSIYKINKL